MRLFFIHLLLFLTYLPQAFAFSCQESGKLYTPVIELAKGNKHVLLIGMEHVGPKAFYPRVQQVLDQWVEAGKGKTVILPEFFTCSTQAWDLPKEGANLTDMDIQKIQTSLDTGVNASDLMQTAAQKTACTLDIDGKTMRPTYLVDRNRDGCKDMHEKGLGCQWGDLHIDANPKADVQPGDLAIDQESRTMQIMGSLCYRGFSETDPNGFDKNKFNSDWNNLFDSFILKKRNKQLVDKTLNALKTEDRVILPWGFAHLDGLQPLLEAQGFKVVSQSDILYGEEYDFISNPDFMETFKEELDASLPRVGNCISPAAALQSSTAGHVANEQDTVAVSSQHGPVKNTAAGSNSPQELPGPATVVVK